MFGNATVHNIIAVLSNSMMSVKGTNTLSSTGNIESLKDHKMPEGCNLEESCLKNKAKQFNSMTPNETKRVEKVYLWVTQILFFFF